MELREKVEAVIEEVVAIRRRIHQHPELGFEEVKTQELVMKTLEAMGIEHRPVAKPGFWASSGADSRGGWWVSGPTWTPSPSRRRRGPPTLPSGPE